MADMNDTELSQGKDIIKKIVDFVPGGMFPKIALNSIKTISIVGLVLGGFSLVLSFVPCLGSWAIFPAVPGIYINLMAIRRGGNRSNIMAVIGLVVSILAMIVAIVWLSAISSATAAL